MISFYQNLIWFHFFLLLLIGFFIFFMNLFNIDVKKAYTFSLWGSSIQFFLSVLIFIFFSKFSDFWGAPWGFLFVAARWGDRFQDVHSVPLRLPDGLSLQLLSRAWQSLGPFRSGRDIFYFDQSNDSAPRGLEFDDAQARDRDVEEELIRAGPDERGVLSSPCARETNGKVGAESIQEPITDLWAWGSSLLQSYEAGFSRDKDTVAWLVGEVFWGWESSWKKSSLILNEGKLLLPYKTRLDAALRVNAIHDCIDDE